MIVPLNYFAVVGGILVGTMLTPQVLKVIRTRCARDLSWGFLGMYLVGISLIFVYCVELQLWRLYLPLGFQGLMLCTLAWFKIRYDRLPAPFSARVPLTASPKAPSPDLRARQSRNATAAWRLRTPPSCSKGGDGGGTPPSASRKGLVMSLADSPLTPKGDFEGALAAIRSFLEAESSPEEGDGEARLREIREELKPTYGILAVH